MRSLLWPFGTPMRNCEMFPSIGTLFSKDLFLGLTMRDFRWCTWKASGSVRSDKQGERVWLTASRPSTLLLSLARLSLVSRAVEKALRQKSPRIFVCAETLRERMWGQRCYFVGEGAWISETRAPALQSEDRFIRPSPAGMADFSTQALLPNPKYGSSANNADMPRKPAAREPRIQRMDKWPNVHRRNTQWALKACCSGKPPAKRAKELLRCSSMGFCCANRVRDTMLLPMLHCIVIA